MREAFIKALETESGNNAQIMLLTGDLGFSVVEGYSQRFPGQYLNVGVAEANMVDLAVGLSFCGKIPFIYTIASFASMRGFAQIRNNVSAQEANVKIVGVGGGMHYGASGLSHHALEDIAIMRVLPGMTVICPADGAQTTAAVKAIVKHKGPVYLRLGKGGDPQVYDKVPQFTIGKGQFLAEGKDLAIIATGSLVANALVTRKFLAEEGVWASVVNLATLKPLDTQLIGQIARGFKYIFTLEEHQIIAGLGGAVAEELAGLGNIKARLVRLGVPDIFNRAVGNLDYLRDCLGLSPAKIAEKILKVIKHD